MRLNWPKSRDEFERWISFLVAGFGLHVALHVLFLLMTICFVNAFGTTNAPMNFLWAIEHVYLYVPVVLVGKCITLYISFLLANGLVQVGELLSGLYILAGFLVVLFVPPLFYSTIVYGIYRITKYFSSKL